MGPKHRRWKALGTNLPTETVLQEAESKESESRAQEQEWSQVLSRLEKLEVTTATQEMFRRFTSGELVYVVGGSRLEFPGGLPQMSNCYCPPGKAGGPPSLG